MRNRLAVPLAAVAALFVLIGTFSAGYAAGYWDASQECRVRMGEIKTPNTFLPLWP